LLIEESIEELNLKYGFEMVRNGMWTWFPTLKFPRVVDPEYTAQRYENPEEAFMVWMDEIQGEHGRGPDKTLVQYVRVIEHRENGDVLFHVLLDGIPEKIQWHWKQRWADLTSGSAWNRRFDKNVEGLIKYLFYKVHCDIEYSIRGTETLCRARKTATSEGE
jgi:hypothetical protein